jgi:hypothetical protein
MGFQRIMLRSVKHFAFERPASKRSWSTLIDDLASGGATVEQRVAAASDTPRNRKQLGHVITIERWGHQRLRSALGQPLVLDESDQYAPSPNLTKAGLLKEWVLARRATMQLAGEQQSLPESTTIVHNQFGSLSLRGWIRYLTSHANLESKRLR